MRFLEAVAVCLLAANTQVLAHPQPVAEISAERREAVREAEELFAPVSDLYKRKGGGGGGGKGGGGGGGSSSSGKGGGSTTGGGSSGSTSGGGRSSGSSNQGGATRTGSGVTPRFGGGKYGGGATQPYKAGSASPRGLAPVFLGVGLLAIYPGIWLYGAYGYGYHNPYNFRNRTARRNATNSTNTPTRDYVELIIRQDDSDSGANESKPVTCLCAEYAVCGCDDDGNYTFLDSIIGDGDYFKLNQSLVTVADVNGTSTILLNGTLPNGTTAAGGTEEADGETANSSGGSTSAAVRTLVEASGYWVMVATVGLTCFAI